MISREELEKYVKQNYTIKKVLNETNYSRSQVIYACKKYNLKLTTNRRYFNIDIKKVKALLDCGFNVSEMASILKVNKRCIYNVMYRQKWTKPKLYPKDRKKALKSVSFAYEVDLSNAVVVVFKNGFNQTTKLSDILKEEIVNNASKLKFINNL